MEWITTFNEAVDALVATGNKEASVYLEDGLVSIPPNLIGPNSNPSELFDWLQGRVRNTFTPLLSKMCEDYYNAAGQQQHAFQSPQAPATICSQRITLAALLVSKWTMKSLPTVISSLVAACQSQQQQQGSGGGAVMSALKSVLDLLSELLDALSNTIRHYVFTNAKLQAHRVITDQSSHMTEKVREHSVRDAFKNIVQIPTLSPVTVLLRAYCATYVLRFDLVERHHFESRSSNTSSSASFSETIASLDHNPAYAAAIDAAADNGDESCRRLTSVLTTLMSVRGSLTDLFRCLSEDLFDIIHTTSSPEGVSAGLDTEVIQPLFNNNRLDGTNALTLALFQRPNTTTATTTGEVSFSSSCCAQALFANLLSSGVKEVVALVSTTTDAFAVPPALRSRIRVSLGTTLISPTSVVQENLGISLSELLNPNDDIVQRLCVAASQSASYTSSITEEQLHQLFTSLSSVRAIIIEETALYRATTPSSPSTNNGENRCYFRANEQHSSILCALLECASKTLVTLFHNHQQDGVSSQAALFEFYTQITSVVSSIIGSLVENGGGCTSSAMVVGSSNNNNSNNNNNSMHSPHDASTAVSTGSAGAYSPWSLAFWKCVRQSPILHIATTVNSIAHNLEDYALIAVISTTAEFLAAVLHVIAEDGSCENPAPLMDEGGDEDDYVVDAPEDECIVKQVAAGAITVSQTWASLSTTNIGRPTVTEALYEGALRIVTAMSEAAVPLLDAVVPSEDVTLSYTSNTAHERTAELGSALEAALGSIITLMKQPLENAANNPDMLFGEAAASSGGGLMAALSSIILLLQATTPANIPEADPDDDPDDFAFIIENTEEDNQRKASRLLLLADLFENIGSTLKCILSLWVAWRLGGVGWNSDNFSNELLMGHLLGGMKASIDDAHVTTTSNHNNNQSDNNATTTTTTDALLFGADFDSVIAACFSVFSRLSEAVGTPQSSDGNQRQHQREGPMAEVSTLLSRAIQANFTQPDFSRCITNNNNNQQQQQQQMTSAIGAYITECITLGAAMPNVAFSLKRNVNDGFMSGKLLESTITSHLLSSSIPASTSSSQQPLLLQAVSISQEARIINCIVPTTSGGIHSTSIASVEYALQTYLAQLTSLGSFIQSIGGGGEAAAAEAAVNVSWCGGLEIVEHRALSLLSAYIMNILDTTSHPFRDALHSRIRGWNHQEAMEGARLAIGGVAEILHTILQTHMNTYYRICLNPPGLSSGVDRVVLIKSVSSINRIFGIVNVIGQFPRQEGNMESFASCLGVLKQAAQHAVYTTTRRGISAAVEQVGGSGGGSLFQAMLDRYHGAVLTCTNGSTATSIPISPVLQSEQALLQALGLQGFPSLLSTATSTQMMMQWDEVIPTLLVLGCGAAGIACQVIVSETQQQQKHHITTAAVQLGELHSHIAASLVCEMNEQDRQAPCQSATTRRMMTSVLTEMMNHLHQQIQNNRPSSSHGVSLVATLRRLMTLLMCVDAAVPTTGSNNNNNNNNNKLEEYWWSWACASDLSTMQQEMGLGGDDRISSSALRCIWERSVVMGMCITNPSSQDASLEVMHGLLSSLLLPTAASSNNNDDSVRGAYVVLLTSGLLHGMAVSSQQHLLDTARIVALGTCLGHLQHQQHQQLLPWVVEACGRGGPITQPLVLVARGRRHHTTIPPSIPESTIETLCSTIKAQIAVLEGVLSHCQQAVASLTADGSLYDAVHAYQSNHLPQHHHAALQVCTTAPWNIYSTASCIFAFSSLLCQLQSHLGGYLLEGLLAHGGGGNNNSEVVVSMGELQGTQQGAVHSAPVLFSALQALRQANTMMAAFATEFKDDHNGDNNRSVVDAGFNNSSVQSLDWWLARQIASPVTTTTSTVAARDILNGDTLTDVSRYIDAVIIRNASINFTSMLVYSGMLNVVVSGGGGYAVLQDEANLANAVREIANYATSSASSLSCIDIEGVLRSGVPSAVRGLLYQHDHGGATSHSHSPLLSANNFNLAISELAKQLII